MEARQRALKSPRVEAAKSALTGDCLLMEELWHGVASFPPMENGERCARRTTTQPAENAESSGTA